MLPFVTPTADSDVRHALFLLGEPRILFAEDSHKRRDRLGVLLAKLTEEKRREILTALTPGAQISKSASIKPAVDGGPELLEFRKFLLHESGAKAKLRLEQERNTPKREISDRQVIKEELIARIQGVKSETAEPKEEISDHLISEVCDRRPISVVKFSPTSEHIAVAGFGGSVTVVDRKLQVATSAQAWSPVRLQALAWTRPGNFLVAGTADGKLVVGASDAKREISVHSGNVSEICFVTDSVVATTSSDGSWTLTDLERGKILSRTFSASDASSLTSAAVHTDSSLLAIGNEKGDVEYWDMRTGRAIHAARKLHGNFSVNSIDFNSYQVASGGSDQRVHIYDLRARRNFREIFAHSKAVSSVRWASGHAQYSDDLLLLVSASLDGTAKIWSPDGQCMRSVEIADKVISMDARSAGGALEVALGCYDRSVRLWSVRL